MKPIPETDVERIRQLRKGGESIKVIAKLVGRSPATVKAYTEDVALSDTEQAALSRRGADSLNKLMTAEQRSVRNIRAAATRMKDSTHLQAARERMNAVRCKAGTTYRKDELPVLRALQARYWTTFQKEEMAGIFFDFANDGMLIEHTIDPYHGVQDVIARFALADANGDSRKRIAYITARKVGSLRRDRLEKLKVEIRDVSELA